MTRFLFILFFFVSFTCSAQSYLGKSRKEIYKFFKTEFTDAKISFNSDSEDTYIRIINGYETLYYYMKNDVCVKFVVYKPYSCNCIETDIKAYESRLVSYGDLKWISQDYSKIYEMSLYGTNYSISVVQNTKSSLASSNE